MRRRAEARREPHVPSGGQQPHVVAVLIHDGEAFDTLILGSRLIDEHHARVEIALLSGDALVDHVGDDVTDTASVPRPREELLAGELLAGEHVPESELSP